METKEEYKNALDRMEKAYFDLDNSLSAMDSFNKDVHLFADLINDLFADVINKHYEEKQDEKKETNLDYYKDEILENCIENLAVVKGRPKLCYKTSCNDCDFKLVQKGCHNKVKDWLKQTHIKPTYKLTKFEKELLECYSDVYSFKVFNSLNGIKEKGYFKGVDDNELIGEILAKCEVV